MSGRRQSPSLVVSIVALVVALGGVAYATIPDATGTIHGCYLTNGTLLEPSGSLRVIVPSKGQKCSSGETALSFNQQGVPGANGVSGYQVIRNQPQIAANTSLFTSLSCPAGKSVISGGVGEGVTAGNPPVWSEEPSSDDSFMEFLITNGNSFVYTNAETWIVCATTS